MVLQRQLMYNSSKRELQNKTLLKNDESRKWGRENIK